ncbi:MAG TPA: alpha/beta fold hydrolase [Candidatus Paceibacterota bacterium]|nr:alpha/beta fold hydrolase [Candidatus Paceibacterota bacterium]
MMESISMHTFRTRFGKNIVADFLPPRKRSNKVVIFCPGMPSDPSRPDLIRYFSGKGYWFFSFRYRGSWESGGKFLKRSPEKDVLDIIGQLPKGFTSAWDKKEFSIKRPEIYLIGTSFGGAAAILASRDKRVKKAVALSPVVDWKALIVSGETVDWTYRFTRNWFGEVYRWDKKDSDKLKNGKFYNPAAQIRRIDGKKLLIVHAKDDKVIPFGPVKKFARETGAKFLLLKKGGHLSASILVKPGLYKRVAPFLRS